MAQLLLEPCSRHLVVTVEVYPVTLNRLVAGFAAVVAACASVALLPGVGSAAGTNLVNNSGFESGTTSGWSCGSSASVVTSPVHSGSYALANTPAGRTTPSARQTISVQPNSAYTLSAWVQGSYVYLGDDAAPGRPTPVRGRRAAAATRSCPPTSPPAPAHRPCRSSCTAGTASPPTTLDDVTLTGPGGSASAPVGAERPVRDRHDLLVGVAVLEQPRRHRQRLQRLPQRQQGRHDHVDAPTRTAACPRRPKLHVHGHRVQHHRRVARRRFR